MLAGSIVIGDEEASISKMPHDILDQQVPLRQLSNGASVLATLARG